jgi:hypothetical protein
LENAFLLGVNVKYFGNTFTTKRVENIGDFDSNSDIYLY